MLGCIRIELEGRIAFRPLVIEDLGILYVDSEILHNVCDKKGYERTNVENYKSGKINTAGASVNTAVRLGKPPQKEYKEKGVYDSGCSWHITGNNILSYSNMMILLVVLFPLELDKDEEDESSLRSEFVKYIDARTSDEHLFEQFSPFKNAFTLPDVPNVFSINDTRIFGNAYDDEDVGAEAKLNTLETTMNAMMQCKERLRLYAVKNFKRTRKMRRNLSLGNKANERGCTRLLPMKEGIDFDKGFIVSQDRSKERPLLSLGYSKRRKTRQAIYENLTSALVTAEEADSVDV
ncbi:hypothetical protein Tco_1004150 [Tanacetum coccineum]|uniref:Uncharacterized protein n=1 Tax=Tanacetum coccineum TaxID=301880 RepID=A0ABQ5FBJ8_9ASTR